MGLIEQLKQQHQHYKEQLSDQQYLQDEEHKKKIEAIKIRIDRHHARQEIARAKEEQDKAIAVIQSADTTPEAKQQAAQDLADYQMLEQTQITQIEQLDNQYQNIKKIISDFDQCYQSQKTTIQQSHHQSIMKIFKDATRDTIENIKQQANNAIDFVVSIPSTVQARTEKILDNAVATLAVMNDTLHEKTEQAKVHGLHIFSKLPELGRSIVRAGRNIEIAGWEKDLARDKKIIETLEKIESFVDRKKEQAREIGKATKGLGSALKAFFTDNKIEQVQKVAEQQLDTELNAPVLETYEKEMAEHKPGFLKRILQADIDSCESRLKELYQEQIWSYEKTLEQTQDIEDRARDTGLRSLEERQKELAEHAIDKINVHDQKLQDLTNNRDDGMTL